MAWLNVDIPIKQCTYHSDEGCKYVFEKEETTNQGVGEIKRDGGWVHFESLMEANRYHDQKYPEFAFFQHC